MSRKRARTERSIERDIRELEGQKKNDGIALISAIFGFDMAYIEGNVGKTVLFYVSCFFFVGLFWWIYNLATYSKRVKEYNLNIDDDIEELEEELELFLKQSSN